MRHAIVGGVGFFAFGWTALVGAGAPRPDALLIVDMHRKAIVERTIAAWPGGVDATQAEALRKTLWSLRADRLLAASLSPGLPGLLEVLDAGERAAEASTDVTPKALGDPLSDLVYTPLTPCRIADTRNVGGPLAANIARTFTATSCGIPGGVAALAVNAYAVNPTITGFIKLWAAHQPEPSVSTVNYEPPTTAIATGTIVPVDTSAGNAFKAQSTSSVHFVVDVVGYFRGPGDANGIDITLAGSRVMRYESAAFGPNLIGGYAGNTVAPGAFNVTIAGGGTALNNCFDHDTALEDRPCINQASGATATIGGGAGNTVAGGGTVAGGWSNTATGDGSTVGGGERNLSTSFNTTVAGGSGNKAIGWDATVGGGEFNSADGDWSTVAGGKGNTSSGDQATTSGGQWNNASGAFATVSGGFLNVAAAPLSTIPGGEWNLTVGSYSLAAGRRAKANSNGCFVWGDSNDADVTCSTNDAFVARATGGVTFGTNVAMTTGCSIAAGGGTWNCTSSRDQKRDFAHIDAGEILDRVTVLPITTWRYRDETSGARHIGPVAQDFHAAFGLGDSDRTIGLIDANGVALAAIQGLNAKLDALRNEIATLKEAVRRVQPTAN